MKSIKKEFDTVKYFRAVKNKISKDIATMNAAQIKDYLKLTNPRIIQIKQSISKTTSSTIAQS